MDGHVIIVPGWLMLRSHWGVGKNATDCYAFAVNDGSGSGHVTLVVNGGRKLGVVTVVNEQPEWAITARPSPNSFRFAMAPLGPSPLNLLGEGGPADIEQVPPSIRVGRLHGGLDPAEHLAPRAF